MNQRLRVKNSSLPDPFGRLGMRPWFRWSLLAIVLVPTFDFLA